MDAIKKLLETRIVYSAIAPVDKKELLDDVEDQFHRCDQIGTKYLQVDDDTLEFKISDDKILISFFLTDEDADYEYSDSGNCLSGCDFAGHTNGFCSQCRGKIGTTEHKKLLEKRRQKNIKGKKEAKKNYEKFLADPMSQLPKEFEIEIEEQELVFKLVFPTPV